MAMRALCCLRWQRCAGDAVASSNDSSMRVYAAQLQREVSVVLSRQGLQGKMVQRVRKEEEGASNVASRFSQPSDRRSTISHRNQSHVQAVRFVLRCYAGAYVLQKMPYGLLRS